MKIEPVIFITPGGVDGAAEIFVRKYAFLIHRLAAAIGNYEAPPDGREVVLL